MRENPRLQRPFRSRRPVAPWPALWHPGKRPPGWGATPFANRASRRCGGSLPVVLSGAIHLFKPLSPGARQPQPSPPVQGEMHIPQNFLPRSRQKLLRSAWTVVSVRGDAHAAKVLKGDGEYRGTKAGPRKRQNRGSRNSKMMGAENINRRRLHHGSSWH